MRIVIALGGNALLQRGEPQEAHIQQMHAANAATAIAAIAGQHNIVLCHGNGPQVGLLALQNAAYDAVSPYPFDVLSAESQGMIGYFLQRALKSALPKKSISTLLTQVEVDENDPAFKNPHKFIGPVYTQEEAQFLAKKNNWAIAADGKYFRRVVPSPKPKQIIEAETIQCLLEQKHLVIAGGGGGIPVTRTPQGLKGIEAVIDKDHTACLMAKTLNADAFIILTDVAGVIENWQTPQQKLIKTININNLKQQNFAAGSMAPKIQAACDFVDSSGKFAAIGELSALPDILAGNAGTHITNTTKETQYYTE